MDFFSPDAIRDRLGVTAFAFRGYNTTNLGRTRELLHHGVYGPVLSRHLHAASKMCGELLARPVDLEGRVTEGRESTLETFGEDIGLIVAVELAQIEMLARFHGIQYANSQVALGYSLGEITALVCGEVYLMHDVLPPLVQLAADCAALAADATMGVLFSRGPELDIDAVHRLCVRINQKGRGLIAISSFLSPNTVLLLGQAETIDHFKERMVHELPGSPHLRKNSEKWPPLHTPLLWARHVPDRAGQLMHVTGGGLTAPKVPVLSLVTGERSYNDFNSREILRRWIDEPQRLWDGIVHLLSEGTEIVIHVGPQPNLLPATFKRLSDNVQAQTGAQSWSGFGLRAMSRLATRPWLAGLLTTRASLLRAPFVAHLILEDWLLTHPPE